MAPPQGLMAFPGVTQVISGSYTLTHGITPGVAQLTIAPQSSVPVQGPLTITYGDVALVLPGFTVSQESLEFNEAGYLIRLTLYDRRLKWRNSFVTGAYNLRYPDGSLNVDTELSLQKMMAKCLGQNRDGSGMGEQSYDVSQVNALLRPEVHWDYTCAAQALAYLADYAGCRVVLALDGKVVVLPEGLGAKLPAAAVIQVGKSAIPPFVPDTLKFVAGPSRYQIDVMLSPVGLDLDGSVKPINDLSYAPADGWGQGKAKSPTFNALDNDPKWGGTRARQYAERSIFRWWQIDPAPRGIDGKPLQIPGYDGPAIVTRQQILPLLDEQIEVWTDVFEIVVNKEGEPQKVPTPKPKRPLLWGFYPYLGPFHTPNIPLDQVGPGHLVPPSTTPPPFKQGCGAEFTRGYGIERETGIVKLHEACWYGILQTAANAVGPWLPGQRPGTQNPAIFALRIGTSVRDQTSRIARRYTQDMQLGKNGNGTRLLVHDECQASYWPSYGLKDNVFAVNSTVTRSVIPDVPPLKDEAGYFLKGMAAQYQLTSPEEALYAGIVPIIPDGAIQVVHWEIGPSGATTRVSRNGELSAVLIPYRERRFLENLWDVRVDVEKLLSGATRNNALARAAKRHG